MSRFNVMGEYYKGNYTENWGVNRVSDDLFRKGLYIPNVGSDADYAAFVAGQPPAGFGNFPGIPLDVENPVKVDRKWKLAAPGDDSNATVIWLQAIQEYAISDSFKLLNNTYFHYKDRETFSSYHYSELQKDNWSIENRLQAIQFFDDIDGINKITLNYGIRSKYQDIWAVNHFANEPANYFDLTRDPEFNRVPDSAFTNADHFRVVGQSGRGVLNNWYVKATGPAASDATDSQTWIIGPFMQADFELTDKLSVLLGYTIDYVDHEDGFPRDVVPLDGNPAAPAGFYDRQNESAAMYNANGSIVFKPTEKTSLYATVNLGEHTLAQNGGAIDTDSVIEPSKTELLEIGFNASLFDDKVYLGAAIFSQEYEERDLFGNVSATETKGFELEINYQPNRNFFATIGYSFLDSQRQPGFFATDSTPADVAPGQLWLTPTFPNIENRFYESPGVPKHLFNALAQYQFDNGFGMQANIVVTAAMEAGYDGARITSFAFNDPVNPDPRISSATLPSQYEIDAKIFYEYKNWRFEFSVFNITDEDNWDLPNTGYANGSAVARAERSYEVSVKYSW